VAATGIHESLGCMAPYQGPRGQNTQGLLHKRLGIQLPPDQERAFWREEILISAE
jgi:hypothetical protein